MSRSSGGPSMVMLQRYSENVGTWESRRIVGWESMWKDVIEWFGMSLRKFKKLQLVQTGSEYE